MGVCAVCVQKENVFELKDGKKKMTEREALSAHKSIEKDPVAEKKRLAREALQFVDQEDKSLVKTNGIITGKQFMIDNCKRCNIYLMDWTSQVMIDRCTDCMIFVAPCESSVVLRDCKHCTVVVACQQLRTRDCASCTFLISCQTQPSIESSSNLKFGPWNLSYFALAGQLESAKLDRWNNKWANVHDFSKKPGEENWKCMDMQQSESVMDSFKNELNQNSPLEKDDMMLDWVTPVTTNLALESDIHVTFFVQIKIASDEENVDKALREIIRSFKDDPEYRRFPIACAMLADIGASHFEKIMGKPGPEKSTVVGVKYGLPHMDKVNVVAKTAETYKATVYTGEEATAKADFFFVELPSLLDNTKSLN